MLRLALRSRASRSRRRQISEGGVEATDRPRRLTGNRFTILREGAKGYCSRIMRLLPNRRASIDQAPVALKSVLVRQAIDALQSRMLNTGGDGYERVLLALSVIPTRVCRRYVRNLATAPQRNLPPSLHRTSRMLSSVPSPTASLKCALGDRCSTPTNRCVRGSGSDAPRHAGAFYSTLEGAHRAGSRLWTVA